MSAWDFEDADQDQEQETTEPAAQMPEESAKAAQEPAEDEPMSMDDVDLDAEGPAALKPGDIVKGIVAAVTEEGVLVDVGGKAEGIVPMYEFLDRSEMPQRDDEIEVAVVKLQDEDGTTILSKKRADYERVWNRVIRAMETGEILDAMVTDRVKGGLRVDLGVAGFVPASHVATRDVRNLDRFVGRSLRLKVLEADRERKKVVLSHRLVVDEEREERRQETLAKLHEGLVCEGKVRNITEYGAFIDLGGVDGLLHVSEMSWGRIEHPSDVCSVGDTLRVVVLEIDTERDRISLGRRQILPDPWKEVGRQLRPGSMVRGRVSRIVRTGAFIDLPDFEVEGFLPVGELSDRRIDNPADVIEEGQELQLQVLKLRPQARRMTLSLMAVLAEKEREEMQKYMGGDEEAPRTTLGDQFADVLGAVAADLGESEAEAPATPKPEPEPEPQDEDESEATTGEVEETATGAASTADAQDEGADDAGDEAQDEDEIDDDASAGDAEDGSEDDDEDDEDEEDDEDDEDE